MNKSSLYNAKRFLLDIIYPNKCPFCGEIIPFNHYCCAGCPDPEKFSLFTQATEELENVSQTFSIFEYDETTLPFVYAIKDGGNGYAISAASKLLCDKLSVPIDLITCIPTDSKRMRQRGYNPPALIAGEMSAISGIPHMPKLLVKTRRTDVQKSLNASQRRENLLGAFAINSRKQQNAEGARILLVDDVLTTGSTLSEAARILLAAGAEKVYAATVAVVVGR